jgi:hypothetical protein
MQIQIIYEETLESQFSPKQRNLIWHILHKVIPVSDRLLGKRTMETLISP